MPKTIVALFDEHSEARNTVEDLVNNGLERDQISLMANDVAGEYSTYPEAGKGESEAGKGGATGAVAGGVLGGLAGVLLGFGTLLIPGVGPIIAAGPIISGLVGAGVGAATGGLLGALIGSGIPKDEAEYYAEGVRRGGTLVMVNTPDQHVDRVSEVIQRHRPVDIKQRSTLWRDEGWTSYSPEAKPYSIDDIRRERERYTLRP